MATLKRRTSILAAIAVVACTVLLSGCSNSSCPTDSDSYLDATSPANVLANFGRAYEERNLDEFLGCLSEDFRFYFTEEDQQGWQLPPWFYKADERHVHENMFGDGWGVESIFLVLMPTAIETIPGADSGRPTDDVVIITVDSDVRVFFESGVVYLASDPQEFRFRVASGGDLGDGRAEWEMFEWYDDECGPCGRVEDAGWGGIKNCFLEELSQQARRTSPADVIDQLKTAYVAMDLDNYLDCLSEDFIFYPTEEDVQDPEANIPPEWYKSDEANMHANMFDEGSNVESISLTLANVDVDHEPGDPQDPLDDTYAHRESVDFLMYVYGGLGFLATEPSDFHLRVDEDEEGPYGEVMWEIYEWHDDPIRAGRDDSREETTWGGIKAMYW